MKNTVRTTRVLRFLLTGSLLAVAASLFADPAAECSQEAQHYAIPPEQTAEYIEGCILSRGGLPDPAAGEAPVPADEGEFAPQTDTEQMNDAVQPDEVLPGENYGTN